MSIHEAIAFGKSKIGAWSYCTAADSRFGQHNNCADCSGFVSRCLWEGGMPKGAFPMSSGDMAVWFVNNPGYRRDIASAKRIFGAVLVYGGFVNGPRGHVVFSLGDGLHSLESTGHIGVNINNINRLSFSHAGLAPISYGAPTPPKPKPPPVPIGEDNMVVVIYKGSPHSFWIDQNGWLQHNWGKGAQENMKKYTPGEHFDARFPVSAAVNGDWLNVRAVCKDAVETVGTRLMCFNFHPSSQWTTTYAASPA